MRFRRDLVTWWVSREMVTALYFVLRNPRPIPVWLCYREPWVSPRVLNVQEMKWEHGFGEMSVAEVSPNPSRTALLHRVPAIILSWYSDGCQCFTLFPSPLPRIPETKSRGRRVHDGDAD